MRADEIYTKETASLFQIFVFLGPLFGRFFSSWRSLNKTKGG